MTRARGEDIDIDDERAKKLCFPEDHLQLFKQIRLFIGVALWKAAPRSKADDVISYSTLMSYRKCLGFWIKRTYPELGQGQ